MLVNPSFAASTAICFCARRARRWPPSKSGCVNVTAKRPGPRRLEQPRTARPPPGRTTGSGTAPIPSSGRTARARRRAGPPTCVTQVGPGRSSRLARSCIRRRRRTRARRRHRRGPSTTTNTPRASCARRIARLNTSRRPSSARHGLGGPQLVQPAAGAAFEALLRVVEVRARRLERAQRHLDLPARGDHREIGARGADGNLLPDFRRR